MSWVAIIIIVLIVLLLIIGVLQFNRLRRLTVQVDGAFAGIECSFTSTSAEAKAFRLAWKPAIPRPNRAGGNASAAEE